MRKVCRLGMMFWDPGRGLGEFQIKCSWGGGNVCPSDSEDSVKDLCVGYGVVVSWVRVGCVLTFLGY